MPAAPPPKKKPPRPRIPQKTSRPGAAANPRSRGNSAELSQRTHLRWAPSLVLGGAVTAMLAVALVRDPSPVTSNSVQPAKLADASPDTSDRIRSISATEAIRATPEEAWRSFTAAPWNHPRIPPVAFAGCPSPEAATPGTPAILITPNGSAADSDSIQQAIDRARTGDLIRLGPGRFVLDKPLIIRRHGISLIGSGSSLTTLHLAKSLAEIRGPSPTWSWSGGWINVSPPTRSTARPDAIAWVDAVAHEGDRVIALAGPGITGRQFAAGQDIVLDWSGDRSLAEHVGMPPDDWVKWDLVADGQIRIRLTNRILRVDGDRAWLAKPLRLPIRAPWRVVVEPASMLVQDVAIGGFRMTTARSHWPGHLKDEGWNGIALDQCLRARVMDVAFVNVDNGIFLRGSHHATIAKTSFEGGPSHHAINLSGGASDNLITEFTIRNPVYHGISVQDLASGNVFRRGTMAHGTFDSHRGMPFDTVRTDIDLHNDGRPGGSSRAGPFAGRRTVHWNVRYTAATKAKQPGRWVDDPRPYPFGLFSDVVPVDRSARRPERGSMPDLFTLQSQHLLPPKEHLP